MGSTSGLQRLSNVPYQATDAASRSTAAANDSISDSANLGNEVTATASAVKPSGNVQRG